MPMGLRPPSRRWRWGLCLAVGCVLSCSFARTARASAPDCPRTLFDDRDVAMRLRKSLAKQTVRIACEGDGSTACRATVILKLQAPRPDLAVPDDLRTKFPEDWVWTALTADGEEGASPSASMVVGFVARGSLTFDTTRRSGLEPIPEGCFGGRRTQPIFVRHPWIAVRIEHVASVPVVADSFEIVDSSEDPRRGYGVRGDELITEDETVGGVLRLGGPFVAVGVSGVVDDDPKTKAALKLRAGYEIARPSWLIHSVAVESSVARGAVRDLVLVPMTEVAPASGWNAHVSFGVGVPVRVDEPAVGFRFQMGMHFPVAGLIVSFDKYFGRDVVDDKIANAFLQLSF